MSAEERVAEEINIQEVTAERSPAERIVIWTLRRWWALAVATLGGAILGQAGGIIGVLINQFAQGQPLSFPSLQSGLVGDLFQNHPIASFVGLGLVLVVTVVAYFADRAEQARLERLAAEEAVKAAAARRQETRTEARLVLEEFFQQQKAQAQTLDAEDDEDGAAGGMRAVVLPPRPTLVIGREADLGRIASALQMPGAQAVALRGMGGVGKSTLLLETLYRQAEAKTYPNGVIWLACQDLVEDDCETQLYDAAGVALGLSEVARVDGARAKAIALQRGIAGRKILIGLDNVEAQMPLDHIIGTLTARNGKGVGPEILLSTRVNWNDVAHLTELDLDVLPPDQGYALLKKLVERGGKGFAPEDEAAARAIVDAVGALPLALELVAPRITRRAEPLAALANRLRDEGVQLKGRTRGIERTFDLTYEQLEANEQDAFSALAVLTGPTFSQEAALTVMAALIGEERATPQILLDLADLSLLREMAQPAGPPRYQMHPLMRQFAREQLRKRGDQAEYDAELAAARFFRGFAHRRGGRGGRQVDTFDTLDSEYTNILGALTWAYQRMKATTDPEAGKLLAQIVTDTCGDLRTFVQDRGYWTDGRRVLRWGAEADGRLGNRRHEASMLASLAFIVRQQGDLDEAERYYKQALEIARAAGDRIGEAARIHNLGTLALMRGDLARARALYEEALTTRRALNDEGGISATLRSLGTVAAEQGQWEEARGYLRESLDLKRVQGISRGRTFCELGSVLLRDPQGDRTQARNLLISALDIARQHRLSYDEARALDWLGALSLLEGKTDEARQQWESALAIYQDLGAAAAQQVRDRLVKLGAPDPVIAK
jgi:tetratricopeptide (TPR) repeat protein